MANITTVKYGGSVPGADANDYELFSTVTANLHPNFFPMNRVAKFQIFVKNPQAGVLKEYESEDGGTNWSQVSNTAVAAAAATAQNAYEFVVEPYRDWKLVWTNGGVAQTGWVVKMAMLEDRGAAG